MLNIYLQHVFQTIIYFMKIQSQNIFFKNIPPLPPWRWIGGPLMKLQSIVISTMKY